MFLFLIIGAASGCLIAALVYWYTYAFLPRSHDGSGQAALRAIIEPYLRRHGMRAMIVSLHERPFTPQGRDVFDVRVELNEHPITTGMVQTGARISRLLDVDAEAVERRDLGAAMDGDQVEAHREGLRAEAVKMEGRILRGEG